MKCGLTNNFSICPKLLKYLSCLVWHSELSLRDYRKLKQIVLLLPRLVTLFQGVFLLGMFSGSEMRHCKQFGSSFEDKEAHLITLLCSFLCICTPRAGLKLENAGLENTYTGCIFILYMYAPCPAFKVMSCVQFYVFKCNNSWEF